jgi:hypothetical protein
MKEKKISPGSGNSVDAGRYVEEEVCTACV